jgi:2-keto-4-pentenoate hydratase
MTASPAPGFNPSPAADALIAARAARAVAGPLPADIAPRDGQEAAAVQRAVAERRASLPVGGFKIGATGKRMQAFLGIDHPCAGFMAAADIHRSGAELPHAGFRTPQVECELAVRLASDLPPGPCTLEEAHRAIGEVFAAIEIVENRYGPPPVGDVKSVGLPTMIADQFYHVAAVIGSGRDDWRDLDLVEIEGHMSVDGEVRNGGRGAELQGHPLKGVAWLAGDPVAAAFGGLRAGQVVLLGSVVPSITLDRPCEVRVVFAGLAPVTVRLA